MKRDHPILGILMKKSRLKLKTQHLDVLRLFTKEIIKLGSDFSSTKLAFDQSFWKSEENSGIQKF